LGVITPTWAPVLGAGWWVQGGETAVSLCIVGRNCADLCVWGCGGAFADLERTNPNQLISQIQTGTGCPTPPRGCRDLGCAPSRHRRDGSGAPFFLIPVTSGCIDWRIAPTPQRFRHIVLHRVTLVALVPGFAHHLLSEKHECGRGGQDKDGKCLVNRGVFVGEACQRLTTRGALARAGGLRGRRRLGACPTKAVQPAAIISLPTPSSRCST